MRIAITGGIGSGKSYMTNYLSKKGYKTCSADEIAKNVLYYPNVLEKVEEAFPNVFTDGKLDRNKLSIEVFSSAKHAKKINGITHPIILKEILSVDEGGKIVFVEVPLLFEGNYQNLFDKIVVVKRKKGKRIAAVKKRDNLKGKDVKLRINCQINYDKYDFSPYTVIENNKTIKDFEKKIDEFIETLEK